MHESKRIRERGRGRERYWVVAAVVAALAVFAWLVVDVLTGAAMQSLDVRVTEGLVDARTPGWDRTFWGLTLLGNAGLLSAFIVASVLITLAWGRWRASLLLAVGTGVGQIVSSVTKSVFGRARPPVSLALIDQPSSHSLPSGHALMSAVFFGLLAVTLLDSLREHRAIGKGRARLAVERLVVLLPSTVVVGLIGLSRVYLGVHWLSDVIAGWALALAWLLLATWVLSRVSDRLDGAATPVVGRIVGSVQGRWRVLLVSGLVLVIVAAAVLTAFADPMCQAP